MRLDRLDLNLLIALDALITERHVTRAGERLHLSQSAMSCALARLRDHFQDQLMVRIGPKLVLTPMAERLRQPVSDLLLRAQKLLDERPQFNSATAHRHFCIVASDFINALLMPRLAVEMATKAPGISIEFLDPIAGHFSEDLDNGDADLLILPSSLTTAAHPSEMFVTDTLVCVVWEENDVVGESLSIDQYSELLHVSANFGRARSEGIEADHLKSLGVRRRIAMSIPQFVPLPQLVVGTPWVATIPRRLAELVAKTLPIRIVTPEIEFPPIEEVLQWHSYRADDPGLMWLRSVLMGIAQPRRSASRAGVLEHLV